MNAKKMSKRQRREYKAAVAWAQMNAGVLDFAARNGCKISLESYDRVWEPVRRLEGEEVA